jgi:uncharacterized iron-regulated protein
VLEVSRRYAWILWIPLWSLACRTPASFSQPGRPGAGSSHSPWSAPDLERATTVRNGRTGELLTFTAFLDELAQADAVFLGETHIDETTHRVELRVYEGLWTRRHGQVVLGLEMFERDVQGALDAYLTGESSEETFLAQTRPWRNYPTAYRPMIEHARREGGVVIASNFPRSLRVRVSREGAGVLEDADEELVPDLFLANTGEYWKRVDNAVRGHLAMMGSNNDDKRLYSTQSLWDNSMGDACSNALDDHPGHLVLHVNGGFHSAYWSGTVRQFQMRKPRASVRTVAIVPTPHPGVADVSEVPVADYVVFAEDRASDVNEGKFAVTVSRSLEYRLHLPENTQKPMPLLIWLSDDGMTAEDGMDLWKKRLGEEVAIAAVEPFYPQIQADLGTGGRWFQANTFASDMGALRDGVERIWGFLMRHYPIDSRRVCLAGEGTGATVAALVALMTDRMSVHAVALSPRHFAKIKDIPLPLAEYRGAGENPPKSLSVIAPKEDGAWWKSELDQYSAIGFGNALSQTAMDPWRAEHQTERALRAALGLDGRPYSEPDRRLYFLIVGDSSRERYWARLEALHRGAMEETVIAVVDTKPDAPGALPLSLDIRPENFAKGEALPMCPGPFGGTTVLVLPAEVDESETAEWLAIESDDPIKKRSRFHRLRVATTSGEHELKQVVAQLKSEGRKNLLIVPATFYADAMTMRALSRSLDDVANEFTIHWRPGLGGRN